MSAVNAALRPVFDLLLAPFAAWPPIVSLVVVSLLVSVLMLVVFKKTSNQAALAVVKRKIHAGIFEIRLFNDDLRAILRAQNEILRHNLTYLRLSLWPMLFLLPLPWWGPVLAPVMASRILMSTLFPPVAKYVPSGDQTQNRGPVLRGTSSLHSSLPLGRSQILSFSPNPAAASRFPSPVQLSESTVAPADST